MRPLSIAVAALAAFWFASSLRADYGLQVVTPENIGEVGNLTVKASVEPSGIVRFVVRHEGQEARGDLKGLLRLKVAENVWTEAAVVPDARPDATEYRFAVAPAHLAIATFNVILSEGLGGEWYEIPLKAFAPKAEGTDATQKEKIEAPKTDKEGTQ